MLEWMDNAKCRVYPDPSIEFFPERGDWSAAQRAKEFCLGTNDRKPCPVLEQCREHGLRHRGRGEPFGVWGGLTQEERRRIWGLKDRRRPTRGVENDRKAGARHRGDLLGFLMRGQLALPATTGGPCSSGLLLRAEGTTAPRYTVTQAEPEVASAC